MSPSDRETHFWSVMEGRFGAGTLSPQQKAAVLAPDGPVLVDAGPGAGKTAVLVWRVAYLLRVRGVPPERVVVVTFSNAAANELQHRIASVVGAEPRVRVSTIHSLSLSWLPRPPGDTRWNLLSSGGQIEAISEALRAERIHPSDDIVEETLRAIGEARNRMAPYDKYIPEGLTGRQFLSVVHRYHAWKEERGRIDFDDILERFLRVLDEGGGAPFRNRVAHLLVDEFQDTSVLQYEILKRLAAPEHCLYVVGDVDQSIYSWRGADPEIMLRFPDDYPGCARLNLHHNYRATATLIGITNCLIAGNARRFNKQVKPVKGPGPAPKVLSPPDDAAEARQVVDELCRLREGAGLAWSEMAVLYRSNYQAIPFLAELYSRNAPIQVRGELPNPVRHEVGKDMVAYLRLALGERDRELLSRIIYRPNRYITKEATQRAAAAFERGATLVQAYAGTGLSEKQVARIRDLEYHLRVLRSLSSLQATTYIWETVGYRYFVARPEQKDEDSAVEARAMYALLQLLAREYDRLEDFVALAARLEQERRGWWKQTVLRDVGDAEEGARDAITLSTCHSAKGLEFDAVAVVGLVDGVLPAHEADVEEERRLAYVAMTRARKYLVLSVPAMLMGKPRSGSPFVGEAMGTQAGPAGNGRARGRDAARAPAGTPAVARPTLHGFTRNIAAHPSAGSDGNGNVAHRSGAAEGSPKRVPSGAAAVSFAVGDRIRHLDFGQGTVMAVDREQGVLTVRFDSGQEKKLLIQVCLRQGKLQRLYRR